MTIRRISSRMSIFITLALFVCTAPSYVAAQMKKDESAEQKIAVQWFNSLMKKDNEGALRLTQLPLSFDAMAPLTDITQVSSAFMTALVKMVRPNAKERVSFRPGSPRPVVDFLTNKKGPPDDQTLKIMSVNRDDTAVPVEVIQGSKQIGILLIVVRNSKVARIFSAAKHT